MHCARNSMSEIITSRSDVKVLRCWIRASSVGFATVDLFAVVGISVEGTLIPIKTRSCRSVG